MSRFELVDDDSLEEQFHEEKPMRALDKVKEIISVLYRTTVKDYDEAKKMEDVIAIQAVRSCLRLLHAKITQIERGE